MSAERINTEELPQNVLVHDLRCAFDFDAAVCSEIGNRSSQQDAAYLFLDDHSIYCTVCDGMGGLGGGELASQTAVQTARKRFGELYGPDSNLSQKDPSWMLDILTEADRKVYSLKDESGTRIGAGSTMVSVWISAGKLYWASVGDSRLYIFRNGELAQATTDLNYYCLINEQRASGSISEQDYEREAESGEALISFLGLGGLDLIDRNTEALKLFPGDTVILCSDGLYRTIDEEWLTDILIACDDMNDVANYIPIIIEENGTDLQDNYTCILIHISDSVVCEM